MKKNKLLDELINKQRKNIPISVLFSYNDLVRIVKNIDKSIFDNTCTIWKGFVHSYKNNYYINFFFKGSKKNFPKLLYYNFIGNIKDSEYIKSICANGGKCCNINHYKIFNKKLNDDDNEDDSNDLNELNELNESNELDELNESNEPDDQDDKDKINYFKVTF